MLFLYNIFIGLYRTGVSVVAFKNNKAKQWIDGRKNWLNDLQEKISGNDYIIWMHCASAGELEQGKPVIEALKENYPSYKILISFFSPSGYSSGKKYFGADFICYLPLDKKNNAEKFLATVNPKLAIFVKYEYWYHHLKEVHRRKIPLLLVSSIFRKDQIFFKWYGSFYKKMLHFFSHIFVQDKASMELLKSNGIEACSVAGDTRFDRVAAIAKNPEPVKYIPEFKQEKKVLIAGSTWGDDEDLLKEILSPELKIIIAPHEINEAHIKNILLLFPEALLYSAIDASTNFDKFSMLIIDNVGMLSKLYQYATITYIGGGFNKSGIHNTLEAAVYGKAVIFGPNFKKFKEARELVDSKAAFSISTKEELKNIIQLMSDENFLANSGEAAKNYVQDNMGATKKIMDYIQANRLLTI